MKYRNTFFLLVLSLLCASTFAHAASPSKGRLYVVRPGDTLSKIAVSFYNDPSAWKRILDATNEKAATTPDFETIADPNRIRTGTRLWLPGEWKAVSEPVAENVAALREAFKAAVSDARIATEREISRDLTAIVESNGRLIWSHQKEQKVLMVTWTSWDGYDVPQGGLITLPHDEWVTAVPELRGFCIDYTPRDNLVLRVEQLLGLPPGSGRSRVVEMWVKPSDMFRPSPDPEISDHEAELNFPVSRHTTVAPDYLSWFNELKSKSYSENGSPWTRLGYTFDWGGASSEIGLSEFVVAKGAEVEIHAVYDLASYCTSAVESRSAGNESAKGKIVTNKKE